MCRARNPHRSSSTESTRDEGPCSSWVYVSGCLEPSQATIIFIKSPAMLGPQVLPEGPVRGPLPQPHFTNHRPRATGPTGSSRSRGGRGRDPQQGSLLASLPRPSISAPHSPVSISREQMGPGHGSLGLRQRHGGAFWGFTECWPLCLRGRCSLQCPDPPLSRDAGVPRSPPDSLLRAAALE